jgi:SpoVK/Ycf46/Vps4 family AAA+-type ATPase
LGEILAAIGYLDSGHVVEVDRAKMVSQYQGETPKVVDALCDKAKGGILFVDEAYTLAPVSASGDRDAQGA